MDLSNRRLKEVEDMLEMDEEIDGGDDCSHDEDDLGDHSRRMVMKPMWRTTKKAGSR